MRFRALGRFARFLSGAASPSVLGLLGMANPCLTCELPVSIIPPASGSDQSVSHRLCWQLDGWKRQGKADNRRFFIERTHDEFIHQETSRAGRGVRSGGGTGGLDGRLLPAAGSGGGGNQRQDLHRNAGFGKGAGRDVER